MNHRQDSFGARYSANWNPQSCRAFYLLEDVAVAAFCLCADGYHSVGPSPVLLFGHSALPAKSSSDTNSYVYDTSG